MAVVNYVNGAPVAEPILLFENILNEGALSASSTAAGTFVGNVLGPQTFDFWKPNSVPGQIQLLGTGPKEVDTFGLVAHTLGSTKASVVVQRNGPVRTNLLSYSQDFSAARWSQTGTIVVTNVEAPDGTISAAELTNTGSAIALIARSVTVPASPTDDYFVSAYAKKGTLPRITMNVYHTGQVETNIVFDLENMEATGNFPYPGEYILEEVGYDWFRIGYRARRDPSGAATNLAVRFWVGSRGIDLTGSSIVWGVQIEAGTVPTSYIPATAAAVTTGWTDASMYLRPQDDSTFIALLEDVTATDWRIRVNGTAVPVIGIAFLGKRLVVPHGVTPDYVPLYLGQTISLMPTRTQEGQYVGTRVQKRGAATSIQLHPQFKDWVEEDAKDFIDHYNVGGAFLFASSPERLPRDAAYCWSSGDPMRIPYDAGALYGSLTMEVEAYVGL